MGVFRCWLSLLGFSPRSLEIAPSMTMVEPVLEMAPFAGKASSRLAPAKILAAVLSSSLVAADLSRQI